MNETITLKVRMGDPRGYFIEKGALDTLTVKIRDGVAIFYFIDPKHTQKFASFEIEQDKKKGIKKTRYDLRSQKAITEYKDMTAEQIADKIMNQFKSMGLNLK